MRAYLLVFVASLAPATALANGGGYNGPDLQPVSVPVALDRGISIGDISQAMYVCLVAGDPSKGLESVIQRAVDQAMPGSKVQGAGILSNGPATYCAMDSDGMCEARFKYISASFSYSLVSGASNFAGQVGLGFYSSLMPDLPGFTLGFSLPGQLGSSVSLTTQLGAFPYVTYDQIFQDGGYDDLGQHRDDRTIVNGLAIVVPQNADGGATAMKTINSATSKPTQVTLNSQEYVQCLVTQIQK